MVTTKKLLILNSRFFIEKIGFIWDIVYVSSSIIAGYNNRIKLTAGTLEKFGYRPYIKSKIKHNYDTFIY